MTRVVLALGTSAGGVGRHVRTLADGLLARGHDVVVAAPASTQRLFALPGHVPVDVGEAPHPLRDARAVAALRRLARDADVVHAHGLRAAALAALAGGAPLVTTLHNAVLATGPAALVGGALERLVCRRSAVVLAVSPDLAARARTLGARDVRDDPWGRPRCPRPSARRSRCGPSSASPTASPWCSASAGCTRRRGSTSWSRPGCPGACAVAGDGPLAGHLRSLGPDVRWLGRRDDLADLYAAADVVVLPSVWEGRPLTAQEVLRAGRPLVATAGRRACPRSSVTARCWCRPGDPGALRAAVAGLLADPGAAAALVAPGTRRRRDVADAGRAGRPHGRPVRRGVAVTRLLAVLGVLLAVLLPGPAQAQAQQPAGRVVLVGAPGLRWDDVSTATPALRALAGRGSTGALSVRAAGPRTCPADGWVMAGTGNRARARPPAPGPCPADLPGAAALPAIARDNATLRFDSEVGLLAEQVRGAGLCVRGVGGRGAELVTGRPSGADLVPAVQGCALVVVDAGQVHHDARLTADLARVDATVAEVVAAADGATVLLAGLSAVSEAGATDRPVEHLHVAVAAGPGFPRGGLVSASTRRAPYVQVVDLAPTVLRLLGLPQPEAMTGQPWRGGQERSSRAELVDLDLHAGQMRVWTPRFFVIIVVAQLLLYGAALLVLRRIERDGVRSRVRRAASLTALAFTAAPVATYLADLLPWWRADPVLPALLGAVALWVGVVVAVALAGPWRRSLLGPVGAVCGVSALVLAADLVTGARLQMSSVTGYSPLVAGRFAGVGNIAFAVFAASALLATACALHGRSRRTALVTCTVVGLACVAVDGNPAWGSDFGGVLALIPGFAVLGMLAAGIRVSLLRLAAVGAAAVAVVASFAVLDWTRPVDDRTHLGRFVQQVLDGDAATVLQRKAAANLGLLTSSVLTLLVPLLVLFVAQVVLRPRGPAREAFLQAPVWRSGLVAVLVMSLVGFAVNDSGVAVPSLALCVAVPAAVSVAVRASGRGPDGARLRPAGARPR